MILNAHLDGSFTEPGLTWLMVITQLHLEMTLRHVAPSTDLGPVSHPAGRSCVPDSWPLAQQQACSCYVEFAFEEHFNVLKFSNVPIYSDLTGNISVAGSCRSFLSLSFLSYLLAADLTSESILRCLSSEKENPPHCTLGSFAGHGPLAPGEVCSGGHANKNF